MRKEIRQGVRSVANVNVLAARLRPHGAKFGIGQRAEEREQSADQPGQIYQFRGADRLHHLGRDQEYAAADDGADYDRGGVADAEVAGEFVRAGRDGMWQVLRHDKRLKASCESFASTRVMRFTPSASELAVYPTANVTTVPMATYQVHGTVVA